MGGRGGPEEQKGSPFLLPACFPCSFSSDRLQVWGTPGTLLILPLSVADSEGNRLEIYDVEHVAWLPSSVWEVQPDRWSYLLHLNK